MSEFVDQLNAINDHLEDAQDATLGMRPEDASVSLNSAVWLLEDAICEYQAALVRGQKILTDTLGLSPFEDVA